MVNKYACLERCGSPCPHSTPPPQTWWMEGKRGERGGGSVGVERVIMLRGKSGGWKGKIGEREEGG